jgi:hypothetical protein
MPTDRSSQAQRDLIFARKRRMGLPAAFSIGDSWFDYPIYANIIDLVDDTNLFAIKRHELSGTLLHQVIAQISGPDALARYGAKTLLVSGGGNDLVDKSCISLLFAADVGQPVDQLINADVWAGKIAYFKESYDELVSAHTAQGISVVVHGYDWLIPTGDGVTFDLFWRGKPWVLPALLAADIRDPARQRAVAKQIVDDLNDKAIKPLAGGARFPDARLQVVYVDCRDAVKPASEWANEMHPTPRGFEEVAARFIPLLHDLLDPHGSTIVAADGGGG